MIVWQMYAFILDEEILNITHCENYEEANRIAKAVYGEEAIAVDCLQYPCQIGDKHINGVFYHVDPNTGDQTPIQYVPTQEQQVQKLELDKTILEAELISTQLALTEQYEKSLALEDEVTNTQIALTEIYERME
ncbi:hypothetical protein [Clostridium sp. chh4-2]|uniref:hypothetical protein n=1 Tax=Clostridium sp. chh4-2 TaxID=2067550 RepID=UPI0015E1A77E|nr:hypothetical protein [Clostridium sp. chh4-2]